MHIVLPGFLNFFEMIHNQALHIELGTVSIILQKIQDVVTNIHEEVRKGSDFWNIPWFRFVDVIFLFLFFS